MGQATFPLLSSYYARWAGREIVLRHLEKDRYRLVEPSKWTSCRTKTENSGQFAEIVVLHATLPLLLMVS